MLPEEELFTSALIEQGDCLAFRTILKYDIIEMLNIVISIIAAYLLGSIPSAYIAGRLKKGIDIRKVGSKNMGTLNVYYEVGLAEAVLVLIVDIAKGIGAILLSRWLGLPVIWQLVTGFMSVAGHSFPIFLQFRGGKGGAPALAILLFLMPIAIPIFVAVAVIALIVTRNYTFCYSVALITFPFAAWLIYGSQPLIFFSIALLLFLGTNYIPRFKEMHTKTGGRWYKVVKRRNLKERL
ncbi:MAG: glycerol-3-phosphate acyltransferase [Chloroflexota bacterium]|nr:glycerol-3-phosphate acyltransferase [Chloroflexota bacterium]